MTYNKKDVVGLHRAGTELLKTLGISCEDSNEGVFCYVNEMTSESTSGYGLLAWGTIPGITVVPLTWGGE